MGPFSAATVYLYRSTQDAFHSCYRRRIMISHCTSMTGKFHAFRQFSVGVLPPAVSDGLRSICLCLPRRDDKL